MSIHNSLLSPNDKSKIFLASSLCDGIEDKNLKQLSVLLREKHADPNVYIPGIGVTPFHLALIDTSETFAKEAVKLFLMYGGNPNISSKDGETPLHLAVAHERVDIIKLLLNHGGDPLILNGDGYNAFHYAFENHNYDIVNMLCEFCQLLQSDQKQDDDQENYEISLEKVILDDGNIVAEYTPNLNKCVLMADEQNSDNSVDTTVDLSLEKENEKLREKYRNFYNQLLTNSKLLDNEESLKDFFVTFTSNELSEQKLDKQNNINEETSLLNSNDDTNCNLLPNENDCQSLSTTDSLLNDSIAVNSCNSDIKSSNSDTNKSMSYDAISYKDNHEDEDHLKIDDLNNSNKSIVSEVVNNESNVIDESNVCNDRIWNRKLLIDEEYKYSDTEEKVVLLERRLCTQIGGGETTNNTSYQSCNAASAWYPLSTRKKIQDPPPMLLRQRLIEHGQNPGPITASTYGVYLKRLKKLTEQKRQFLDKNGYTNTSAEDDKLLNLLYKLDMKEKNHETVQRELLVLDFKRKLSDYQKLEEEMNHEFIRPKPNKRWREGTSQTSFNYLLLDPRVTRDLPRRADKLTELERWQIFLSAIFYVGKGKRSRPYAHLYDAFHIWTSKNKVCEMNKKCQRIVDIWNEGQGVVALHVFQNIIPVEAYTREAVMIEAMGLENLANCKYGEYYGPANLWSSSKKRKLGRFLLHKAMEIMMHEGERQLFPENI